MTARPARRQRYERQRGFRYRQSGYVLVSVLATLVLLAVVVARLDARVAQAVAASDRWGQHTQAQAEVASAREVLLYTLSTQPLTARGFGPEPATLRVDGRHYRLGRVLVQVQDMRGLISVVATGTPEMRNFLLQQGVADREADALLDKLADYNDLDDLRRLNGAEAADYAAAGLPAPRNDWPLSAHELRAVLGWHAKPQLADAASENFTAVREAWVNVNSAPRAVLLTLPGATGPGVRALLALREQRHLASAEEVAAATGMQVLDEPASFFPGQFYRLRLWAAGQPQAVEYTVMLAPQAPEVPWLVLETRHIPAPASPEPSSEPTAFPFVDDRMAVLAPAAASLLMPSNHAQVTRR